MTAQLDLLDQDLLYSEHTYEHRRRASSVAFKRVSIQQQRKEGAAAPQGQGAILTGVCLLTVRAYRQG